MDTVIGRRGAIGLVTALGVALGIVPAAEAGKRRKVCKRCGSSARCKRSLQCCGGVCAGFDAQCCDSGAFEACPTGQTFQCTATGAVCVNGGGHENGADPYCPR